MPCLPIQSLVCSQISVDALRRIIRRSIRQSDGQLTASCGGLYIGRNNLLELRMIMNNNLIIKKFRKINRVNAIIAKFLTILKLQPNRATLRSDLTQAVRKNGGKRRQICRRFSIFHRISPKRINLRGLGTESPTAVKLQICPQSISQTENTPDPSL